MISKLNKFLKKLTLKKIIRIPNLISDETPFGETEDENIEVRRIGKVREFDFEPKAHWDLVEELDIADFERC